jgi:hypothetical protein
MIEPPVWEVRTVVLSAFSNRDEHHIEVGWHWRPQGQNVHGRRIEFARALWALIPQRRPPCRPLENDHELTCGNEPIRWLTVLLSMNSKAPEGISPMRRKASLAILATVSALTVVGSMSSAPAKEAIQDSFCLQGRQWGYPGNCQFSSYEQCMATASGTDAYCGINPMVAFAQQRRGGYQGRY